MGMRIVNSMASRRFTSLILGAPTPGLTLGYKSTISRPPTELYTERKIFGDRGIAFLFLIGDSYSGYATSESWAWDGTSNSSAFIFFHNTTSDSWLFAPAWTEERIKGTIHWVVRDPIGITFHDWSSLEYPMDACRYYAPVAQSIMYSGGRVSSVLYLSRDVGLTSIFYLSRLMMQASHTLPIPANVVGYNRKSNKADVTIVLLLAWLFYSFR